MMSSLNEVHGKQVTQHSIVYNTSNKNIYKMNEDVGVSG